MTANQLIAQALGDAMMAAIQHKAEAEEFRRENEKLRQALTQERLDAQAQTKAWEMQLEGVRGTSEALRKDLDEVEAQRDKLLSELSHKTTKR